MQVTFECNISQSKIYFYTMIHIVYMFLEQELTKLMNLNMNIIYMLLTQTCENSLCG